MLYRILLIAAVAATALALTGCPKPADTAATPAGENNGVEGDAAAGGGGGE